jgi:hypothetical protein
MPAKVFQNRSSFAPRWNGATGVGARKRIRPQLGMPQEMSVISSTIASSPRRSACRGAQRCSGALMPTTTMKVSNTAASGRKPATRLVSERIRSLIGVRAQTAMTQSVPISRLRKVMLRSVVFVAGVVAIHPPMTTTTTMPESGKERRREPS